MDHSQFPLPHTLHLEEWHVDGFLDEFKRINTQMPERAYAFVLGSGASRTSGIPTGAELVDQWLKDLYRRDPKSKPSSLERWANEDQLGIRMFQYERRSEYYPEIYKLRFEHDHASGQASLEDLMDCKEPSFGYTVLARILAKTRHKVVVTTNFDNLVADAVFIYTGVHPLVCGHEQLAQYVHLHQRRPLVAKVHRDLFYDPQSEPEHLSQLAESWQKALKPLFTHYTPIVIGYGGNDGTLMTFLENLDGGSIPGHMFWCHVGDGTPRERILSVIRKQRGVLVRIPGFDELMLLLNDRLNFRFMPPKEIISQAETRYDHYMSQIQSMSERAIRNARIRDAFETFLKELDPDERDKQWRFWEYKARRESKEEDQERTFREGLLQCQGSARFHSSFACFLTDVRKEFGEAKEEHEKAYRLGRRDAIVVANYASFCAYTLKDVNTANTLFREAVKSHPNDSDVLYKYALFLARSEIADDQTVTEYFQSSVQNGPHNVFARANYAWWLLRLGRYSQAKEQVSEVLENTTHHMQLKAELCVYIGLIRRLERQEDIEQLSHLKILLSRTFKRVEWPLKDILNKARDELAPEDVQLYTALVDAILDEKKTPDLEKYPRWREPEDGSKYRFEAKTEGVDLVPG